jgi:hypothetical protein
VRKISDCELRAHQNDPGLRMFVKKLAAGGQGDSGPVVTTHAINGYRVHAEMTEWKMGAMQKPKSPTLHLPHRA